MEENEHLMQAKEVEMLVEESRLFSIDEEAIAALEAQAKVYEQALVEIASELEWIKKKRQYLSLAFFQLG